MTDFWSGWVILLSVFTLAASLFLFIYGLWVDIPTARVDTCGRTACCAKVCEIFRSGGS